ncbi:MAG TPA: hypothetical protein VF719_07690, partial [Abditibacteriaceae bacterium]
MALRNDGAGVVLGFYRDHETAQLAIAALRRRHFVRSAILHKSAEGRIKSGDNDVLPREGALVGVIVGLLLALLFFVLQEPLQGYGESLGLDARQFFSRANILPIVALFPVVGAAAGFLLARVLDFGVGNRLLARYGRWVVRDETLIVVQAAPEQMALAHELMRETGTEGPKIFVVRSSRDYRAVMSGEPERSEPLTLERLQTRARRLASSQRATIKARQSRSHETLLKRLQDSERTFKRVERSLTQAGLLEQSVSISANWLLDNAYVVQGQIKDVRRNLPTGFYRELPVLSEGAYVGTPRAYIVAADMIANTESRVDRQNMTDFLQSYQEVEPLKVSELWAMPLMFRLALIESLRHLTIRIDERQHERERADFWANRLLLAAHRDADQLVSLLSDLAREHTAVTPHFADRLASQLYDEEGALSGVRSWIERKLDKPLSEIVLQEQRRQTADQVAIANIIISLRGLLDIDWREIFEDTSLVHQTLAYDPVGVYSGMDFATRDRYRHSVEQLARGSRFDTQDGVSVANRAGGHAELEVARAAISLAVESAGDPLRGHVGYYLVDDGQDEMHRRVRFSPSANVRFRQWILKNAGAVYIGSVVLFTSLVLLALVRELIESRLPLSTTVFLVLLALVPASELAVAVLDYLLTRLLPPRGLARLSLEGGIPHEWKTLVVVPMMLSSLEELQEDLERLEVRSIANPQENLHYALLSDFTDANEPHKPEDEPLLTAAKKGIRDLNERYGAGRFFLFHRPRQWCESENAWIGWERKRGKLEELNHFLMTGVSSDESAPESEHSLLQVGDAAALAGVRFVITLDADTQLPHDTARHMIEALAHPLNRPQLSEDGRVVTRGYGIIQPRVSTALPSAIATRFSRLFTDARGTDPYTHLVSNVYQDLSGEGAYHGKGIYDLQVFSAVLSGRFPTDTLLSHDLLEGSHIRVGLATDIELFDQFPSNYLAYAKRQHRWIRGDWQISPWLRRTVPHSSGQRESNVLSALNRWKVFDNLRRSLFPITALLLLLVSWLAAPGAAKECSVLVGSIFLVPVAFQFLSWITSRPFSNPFPLQDIWATLGRALLGLALLPHQATLSLDAIGRVWHRRLI